MANGKKLINQNICRKQKMYYQSKTQTMEAESGQAPLQSLDSLLDNSSIIPQHEDCDSSQSSTSPIIYTFKDPYQKSFCQACKKQISSQVSIISEEIARCVGCFGKIGSMSEEYLIVMKTESPLLDLHWPAKFELGLILAIERYGFGNWCEIKDRLEYIGCKFSEEEIRNHYESLYLGEKDFMPVLFELWKKIIESHQDKKIQQPMSLGKSNIKISMASLTTTNREDSKIFPFQENQQFEHFQPHLQPDSHNILGYNEKRGDFEVEYDQNAENLLTNLQFRDDDTPAEIEIKYKILDLYNQKIQKREKVKKFVLDHRLLDIQYQQTKHQEQTFYQNLAERELAFFAMYMSPTEHHQLIKKLAFSKQLQSIIEGLRRFRKVGGGLKEMDDFLNEKTNERPKKKQHIDETGVNRGNKKFESVLQTNLKLNKRDLETIVQQVVKTNEKVVHKNVEAFLINKHF